MRKSKDEKALSHKAIVEQAAHLFRERGIEQTSVADVMQAAQMTHGGFYRHFQSKDELVSAAIESAAAEVLLELGQKAPPEAPRAVVDRYVSKYLSEGHAKNARIGCPIAALAVDAGRTGGGVAASAAHNIRRVIDALALHLPGTRKAAQERAAVTFATLVGAIILARAAGNSEVGEQVLAASRKALDV